jgi:hypothetical protein
MEFELPYTPIPEKAGALAEVAGDEMGSVLLF